MNREKSEEAAALDRLRIIEFQQFWKKVNENVLMLRHIKANSNWDLKVAVVSSHKEVS